MSYDLVIRNGTVVDGLGGEPYRADVAVSDGVIVAVGTVDQSGTREIDATGLLVTPGFVDLHTHYDGQAIWSDRMTPSFCCTPATRWPSRACRWPRGSASASAASRSSCGTQ